MPKEVKGKNSLSKSSRQARDPYPGDAPVSAEKIRKYKRGHELDTRNIKTSFHKQVLQKKDKQLTFVAKQAARMELLRQEEAGFIENDGDELTCDVSQHEIARSVDLQSAQKFFELKLNQFGPYRMKYSRNGRHLLLVGRKGHTAALDWMSKKLMCEFNAMETCEDVAWLHQETMFAVAQKQWTYVYDNQGVEVHCLKALDSVVRLEFLPYHFLLASGSSRSYLSYIDVSIGQKVAGFGTGLGRLDVMTQNPSNAVIVMGHTGGTVTMWSPNVKEPLVKMLCHGSGTRSIAVDQSGSYMATSGIDRSLKIWDLRTYKLLQSYRVAAGAGTLAFSQRGLLAAGIGNTVEVYKDICSGELTSPYMCHRVTGTITNVQFCPFEDILGVGHEHGFSSLIIPGAGEPNFDALEVNPYRTKKQRQEAEVKMLLEKVSPEMISLDTSALGQVDTVTWQQRMEQKKQVLSVHKPSQQADGGKKEKDWWKSWKNNKKPQTQKKAAGGKKGQQQARHSAADNDDDSDDDDDDDE